MSDDWKNLYYKGNPFLKHMKEIRLVENKQTGNVDVHGTIEVKSPGWNAVVKLNIDDKELSMAKEVAKEKYVEPAGRECAEVHFGQAVQIGITAVSNLNAKHEAHAKKLESKMTYVGHGVEFKFDGKECLVPMSVIKLIIFA